MGASVKFVLAIIDSISKKKMGVNLFSAKLDTKGGGVRGLRVCGRKKSRSSFLNISLTIGWKGFKKFDTPHIYFLWQGCLLANHPCWFRCHRHNLSSPLHVSKPYSAGHVMRKQQLLRVFSPNFFFWLPLHALRCRSLLPRQCFQQGLSAEWGVHIRPSHSACMSSGISMLKLWNCRHVPGASFAVILFSEKMFWRNICKEM